MGFKREKLEQARIQVKFETLGGATYFFNGKPLCLARLKAEGRWGEYCTNEAGLRTDHLYSGRCIFHGGDTGQANLKHGRYAKIAKKKYAQEIEEYSNDPDILNITPELALQRVLLSNLWEKYQQSENPEDLRLLRTLVNDVILTVEKVERIQSQQVLTAASARLMMAKAVEVQKKLLIEWFGDPQIVQDRMSQFLLMWRSEVEP